MSIFSALLMMLGRERNNPAKNLRRQEAQMFTNFIRLIEQHHSSTREANYYAQSLNTTYKTLNQLCKKISGRTAKYHIDEYIILEAKRQLTIDRLDIASLAYDLGFDEPTNFTKFFKRHTGRTPKQFQV
jgi:methylphosphotriester-DNA--protein-cysteine methyltransferase